LPLSAPNVLGVRISNRAIARASDENELAAIYYGGSRRSAEALFDVMRRQDDRVALTYRVIENFIEHLNGICIESGVRLVEQNQRRAVKQNSGDADALLQAARKGSNRIR
jgi:hypothetical protein